MSTPFFSFSVFVMLGKIDKRIDYIILLIAKWQPFHFRSK